MKLLHTADLHLGKRVRGFSLLEEQRFALQEILEIVACEHIQAVIVAGDVFDKPIPPIEALELFEWFALELASQQVVLIALAGNHDSAERLAFGATFSRNPFIHIAKPFSAVAQYLDFSAEGTCLSGQLTFDCDHHNAIRSAALRVHLLPFIRPIHVRSALANRAPEIETYTDALRIAADQQPLLSQGINLLVAHQFVTSSGVAPETSESETISIGGLDNVDASAFDAFDYVALGHLHKAQRIGRDTIRYSGSLYPYSISEAGSPKTVTVIDCAFEKSSAQHLSYKQHPLRELRTLRTICASFEELKALAQTDPHRDDYVHIILSDSALANAMERVRSFYPHTMQLEFARAKTQTNLQTTHAQTVAHREPIELIKQYFLDQTESSLTSEQEVLIQSFFANDTNKESA